jgi:hypothetical protein
MNNSKQENIRRQVALKAASRIEEDRQDTLTSAEIFLKWLKHPQGEK